MLKAYIAELEGAEWCTLVHGETRGKAKSRFARSDLIDYLDSETWNDIRLRRLPGCDNKPFTYENSKNAGFLYRDLEREDEFNNPVYCPPEDFINDCNCAICSNKKE